MAGNPAGLPWALPAAATAQIAAESAQRMAAERRQWAALAAPGAGAGEGGAG